MNLMSRILAQKEFGENATDSVAENGYNANEYIRNNLADVQFVRKIHFCYLNEYKINTMCRTCISVPQSV